MDQVVVHAAAFGEAQEHGLLIPMLEATRESARAIGLEADILNGAVLAADAGFAAEANAKYLFQSGVDGYLADTLFRKRDPRFVTAERHKPEAEPDPDRLFRPAEFDFDEQAMRCICPAGKRLSEPHGHVLPSLTKDGREDTLALLRRVGETP